MNNYISSNITYGTHM